MGLLLPPETQWRGGERRASRNGARTVERHGARGLALKRHLRQDDRARLWEHRLLVSSDHLEQRLLPEAVRRQGETGIRTRWTRPLRDRGWKSDVRTVPSGASGPAGVTRTQPAWAA